MGKRDFYQLGTSNAICAVCGFKRKRSEMKLRWDGVWCCEQDWEIRQPQDFVRGVPQETAMEWTQPEVPDNFDEYVNLAGGSGYLGGTAIIDNNGQTVGVMYGNVLQGTPSIFLNGSPVSPTITQEGILTFTVAPPSGSVLSWTGTWINNALQPYNYTSFPFALGDGFTLTFQLYGVY